MFKTNKKRLFSKEIPKEIEADKQFKKRAIYRPFVSQLKGKQLKMNEVAKKRFKSLNSIMTTSSSPSWMNSKLPCSVGSISMGFYGTGVKPKVLGESAKKDDSVI